MAAPPPIDPALEAQYNIRALIPDHAEIFARWRERSAETRRRRRRRSDLAYGASAGETLDLFLPDPPSGRAGPVPVHLFIHGGYWQAMDKDDFSFVAEALLDAGVAVAVVGYALCPTVALDEIVAQMRRALAWIAREAPGFGGDPARIQIAGHSAGGHLVAMLMADERSAPLIHSGVSISGLFDLAPLRATGINTALGLDAAAARRNSPLFLEPRTGDRAPLVLAVGGAETPAFRAQSDALAKSWGARGVPVRRLDLAGRDHFAALDALAEPESALFRAARDLAFGDAR